MPKAKGRKQEEEEDVEDVDVSEEETPKSKKGGKGAKEVPKKGGKGKKEESEDEEDDEPKKGGKQQKKKGKGDDSEDEKPQKGKQVNKKGKKEESDEEEEPQQKGKQNKKGGKQQKKGGKKDESEEEEEEPQPKSKQSKKKGGKNDDSEEEEAPQKKGGKQANKKNGKKVESEDEEPTPKKGGKQQKKGKKDESEDEEEAPKKGGKQQQKKGKKDESEDEEEAPKKGGKQQQKKGKKAESEDEEEKPVQKGKQQQGKKGGKKAESEDEESEDEPVAKKGGKQQQKKGKKAESEDDEPVQKGKQQKKKGKKDEDSEEEEKPVQKGKQANKKPAKKEESEEEEDEEEEEEESEEEVPKKGGKALPAKKNAPKKQEEEEPQVVAAGMVSKKNKKNNKKKGNRKVDSDSEPEVKGGGFAGLEDDKEEEAPAGMVSKKNKKQNKPAAKNTGFAGLDVEDDEEEEPVAPKNNAKKQGKGNAGGFAGLDVEDDDVTSQMASLSIDKKAKKEPKEPKEPKAMKSADDTRSKKQIRMERKNAQRQSDQPKEEAREKTREELEEEALARIEQAQAMKGREPPAFVHLSNSEETRSKLGNDIKVDNYTLTVPGRTLLTDASFTLAYGHRYGFVGRNGLGKSSLLQKIADRDGIKIASHLRVLYVEQEVPGDDTTPIDYVLKADVEREWLLKEEKALLKLEVEDPYWMDNPDEKRCYGLKEIGERLREIESEKATSRAASILVGLGFDAEEIKTKPSREFSGGWRMRISLARALFCRPEVLLLDEPTNHLDLHACFWLERYLSKWKSTLLVVSHEATFLNEIVDHILEIRNKQLTVYRGDYWTYQKTRDINDRTKVKQKDKNDKEKARLREVIQRTAGKAGASGKDKILKNIQDIAIERDDPSLKVSFPDPDKLPPPIYQFHDVSFGYDPAKLLFKNLEFGVDMDSRIALVGLNGVGKSTLMKLMAGELKETSGYISRNRKCRIARFSQHSLEQLDVNLTPAEYLDKKFDIGSEHALRQHLGRFGITGNLALNKIETLSGGQKSRVVLAELAWAEPHILFLDEPSNHLDLDAIEALAQGLENFGGGVVLISHNQRLISLVCHEIWVVTKAGTVDRFNGEFDDYKEDILAHMDFEGESEEEDEQVVREREREAKKAKKTMKEEKEMEKTDRKKGGGKKNKK